MNRQEQVHLVGHFLESLRTLSEEDERFEDMGVHITSFELAERHERHLWDCIKLVIGMPAKEEIGVFVSDHWFGIVCDFIDGSLAKDTTIRKLINWQSEPDG